NHQTAFSVPMERLRNQSIDHLTCYIRQTISATQMFECKLFMIQTHQFQNGCMKVVYMHWVLGNIISEFIGLTIHTGFYTTACHPNCKATRMMVTSIIIFCQWTLAIISTTKLSTPDH